ncbi:divergent polysaccharide deacetylase family protein [Rhizobium sp. SGZ-381]|uniref:divergent polysaccharide deacetylase family protein n=1 Tax=Rhizobium sp. SGZ-381 TaxID=3342800 RepID=UPI00366D643C
MGTDLRAPLGPGRPKKARPRRGLSVGGCLLGLAAAALLGVSFYLMRASGVPDKARVAVTVPLTSSVDGLAKSLPEPSQSALPDEPPLSSLLRSGRTAGVNAKPAQLEDGTVVTTFSPRPRDGSGPLLVEGARIGQDPRLAALPNDDLLEETRFGRLPVKGPDGLRPMDHYARPWSGARGPRIAIVIGGLGLSQTGTQKAIRVLPGSVTFALAASGNSLQRWMQEARRSDHEILLQIPMEPFDYPANDPGPLTLVSGSSSAQNLSRLHEAMGRITNYTGVVNFLGGRYLADPQALQPVLADLARRGLLFLDDGSSAQSKSGDLARTLSLPHGFADLTLDTSLSRQAILKKLDDLERIAQRQGSAIGIGSAFDETVDAVAEWLKQAQGRGVEIVGVSALLAVPEHQ